MKLWFGKRSLGQWVNHSWLARLVASGNFMWFDAYKSNLFFIEIVATLQTVPTLVAFSLNVLGKFQVFYLHYISLYESAADLH